VSTDPYGIFDVACNTFNAKLERLMLSYSPSDFFSASVGRYHTGIGYYNTAYHHGTWFQTATGRPLIFNIDGDIGVIPIHTLGVTTTGSLPSGPLGLHYIAEFGSGRAGQSSAAVAPQPSLNDNNTPSMNLGLWIRPEVLDAFRDVDHILHAGDIGGEEVLAGLGRIAQVTACAF